MDSAYGNGDEHPRTVAAKPLPPPRSAGYLPAPAPAGSWMLQRFTTLAMAAWLGVLFCAVIPMHDRGAWSARLDGSAQQTAGGEVLCPLCVLVLPAGERDAPTPPSPADSGSACPICHFNGTLDLPAPGLVLVALSERLDWLAARRDDAHRPAEPAPLRRLAGRAPPAVA